MLSIWLSLGATQTSASSLAADQEPLFPPEMFVLTLVPTSPLEGTVFQPVHLSSASMRVNYIYKNRGGVTASLRESHPIPLLRADVAGDFR
jgi:hypothetical protein